MRREPRTTIHVIGPRKNALLIWRELHRRRGKWHKSELFGDAFRFAGSGPGSELNEYRDWLRPLLGPGGRVATFRADPRPRRDRKFGGTEMYEPDRESVIDQSLIDTFPASDPLSITQPGGGPNTSGIVLAPEGRAGWEARASRLQGRT